MSLVIGVLAASGVLALVGGAIVLLFGRRKLATPLAALALWMLGLLHLGWAWGIQAISRGGRDVWFDLALAFALPVSLAWVLLSTVLARRPGPRRLGAWRYYLSVQALISIAAIVAVNFVRPTHPPRVVGGETAIPLTTLGQWLLRGVLLNLVLLTANFESTYLSLSQRDRRPFRAALVGILLCFGLTAFVIASSLLRSRIAISEIGWGGMAAIGIGLLFPLAMIRGRIAVARVERAGWAVYKTASLILGIGFFVGIDLLLHATRGMPWRIAREIWLGGTSVGVLGLGVLAFSNRLQRRLGRVISLVASRGRLGDPDRWARLTVALESVPSLEDLLRRMPGITREFAEIGQVTVFALRRPEEAYVVVGSSLDPAPREVMGVDDPLPHELRRSRRAIRLHGRSDDFEYIPIYVENARQIIACEAVAAVPLLAGRELLGFLLCGPPREAEELSLRTAPLLELMAQQYTRRMKLLAAREGRAAPVQASVEADRVI